MQEGERVAAVRRIRWGEGPISGQHKTRRRWIAACAAGTALAAGAFVLLPNANADEGPSGVQGDFAKAAAEYGVPESVLLGLAHEESGWVAHKGYSADGGWGLMNLTDVTPAMVAKGPAGTAGRADADKAAARPSAHTLRTAAGLTGLSADELRTDTRANIRGGAALLASYQKQLGHATSDDPADWTGALAKYSGRSDRKSAASFVRGVFDTLRKGDRLRAGGDGSVSLSAAPSAKPADKQLDTMGLRAPAAAPAADCPSDMSCDFVPAAAENYQAAHRPANGVKISEIVIHTTEESYEDTIKGFQTPGQASAQYVMRSSDGAVTQMVANTDVAFGDGNYWSNLHSVQIEHEGYSARGADWYSDAAYQQTADLVKYLADKYGVPLDRQHVVGHDNVPAPTDDGIADQHWDPGYAWDWARFMTMLGAPAAEGAHGVGETGTAVTIAPGFDDNEQTYTVCPEDDPTGATTECGPLSGPSNSLFVRSAPADDAPLLLDPTVHPDADAGTDRVNDWTTTVQEGQQFVVAGQDGDWTAIWFDGQKGWFKNPGGKNTVPAPDARIVTAAGDDPAPVYGTAYPEASEYPDGLSPSAQKPLTAKNYAIPTGQAYVAAQPPAQADDFFPANDTREETVVPGAATYYTVQFNHRYIQVDAADVTATGGN
ncbi:N-acetylmuramoyl-L-alanine amidase [Streptomyces sp. NPDC050560]|uniref:N-acetylmuramoyl-L-alanine amidase n=1 Tax=Streptomyces sp. NPDC050560 TaxID=3365630 RepID=UPI00379EB6B5